MKNKLYIYVILTVFFLIGNLFAEPIITFFMEPYVQLLDNNDVEKIQNKIRHPRTLLKMQLNNIKHSLVKGIISTYAGFVSISDANGMTSFPKKHVLPLIYLLITDKITPIMMSGQTVHHWEIASKAKMYKVERLHDASEELYYWTINEVPLPENNQIPLESITILLKPKHVVITEGLTLTDNNINLVLPTIYIKKGIKINKNALYLLTIRQFFGHTYPVYKKGTNRYFILQTQ